MHLSPHAPGVARIRVGRDEDTSADRDIGRGDGCKPGLGASKNIGEEVDLGLNVLFRSQAGDVATHEYVEVNSWGRRSGGVYMRAAISRGMCAGYNLP